MNSRIIRLAFVMLSSFVIWAFYIQFEPSGGPPQKSGAKGPTQELFSHHWREWLDESYLLPGYKWRDLLEHSHTEPTQVAKQIQWLLNRGQTFASLDYAYLYLILNNLQLSLNEQWIADEIDTVPPMIAELDWLQLMLESERVLHDWHNGKRRSSYLDYEAIMDKAEQQKFIFLMPRLLNWTGNMALAENELLLAQKHLLKSIHFAEQYGDVLSQSKSYYNLYKMHFVIGQWREALFYIKKAREYHAELPEPDPSTQQLYWYNESVVYASVQDLENATTAHQQAHSNFLASAQTPRSQVLDIRGAANIAFLKKDYEQANKLIDQCIHISDQHHFVYSLGRCHLKLARLNVAQKNYPAAKQAIVKSLDYFEQHGNTHSLHNALKYKSDIFALSGDYTSAYELAKRVYQSEKDQLLHKLHNLAHAQESLDLLLQRDQLTKQNDQKNEALTKQSRNLTVAKWLGMVAMLVMIAMYIRTHFIQRENARLVVRSSVDHLTGLYNRHYYYQQLVKGEVISLDQHYHLALLDIDHFKSINDTYGHLAGDEVLQQLAERIRPWLHSQELFIRWGGEEFLLLIKADGQAAERLEHVLKTLASAPFITTDGLVTVTSSIGVSRRAKPSQLLADESYFIEADECLYIAKQQGRNRLVACQ